MRNLHLLACLVLSGFAGLAYELLWVRLLALGFGSTTLSFSTVLAVFFGGLALGAWLGGRWAPRVRRPVRAYALLELGTGLLALVLYPAIAHIGPVFALVDPGSGLGGGLVRAALAIPLLLGPTVLMGATLPIVTRALVVDDEAVGTGSALIYGFNTVGAFLGTYLVTFFFIPELGVFWSTILTVLINLLVAGGALAFEDRRPLPEPAEADADEAEEVSSKIRTVAVGLAFLGGFAAICFQVVWVRLFSIFLDGTVYGVGSVLIAVLVGIGVGSLVIARPLRRSRRPGVGFVVLQIVILGSIALLTSALPWIAYTLRSVAEVQTGLTGLHLQLALVFFVLLVPSLASGASFPLLMTIVEHRAAGASRALGGLYASNTLGSISGSLITGFVLIPLAGTVATLFLGLIVIGLVGALAAALLTELRSVPRLALAALPLALVAGWQGFDVQLVSMGGRGTARGQSYARYLAGLEKRVERLVYFSEGQAATVAVSGDDDARSLSLNGLGQGSRRAAPPHHVYESLMVALVPMAHVDRAEKALVVGLGAGVTVDALLELGAAKVDVVELEPDVVEGLGHIFPEEESPLRSERVTLTIGDARHALLVASRRGGGGYDVITSMPAHPWVAANIFTQEFFELARDNLSEDGVFSTWFGLGRMDQETIESLARAFALTFEHYVIYRVRGAGALYLVGSKRPLSVDVERFAELREVPTVASQPAIESDYHLARQVAATGRAGDPAPTEGVINTDDSAFVETRAPRTSSAAADLGDALPHRALRADFLAPSGERARHALALLEHMMGSPGARLATRPTRIDQRRLEATFEGLEPALDEETKTYVRGRLALLAQKREEARALLTRVTSDALRPRALRFLPFTYPEGPKRAAALRAAPDAGDVWIARLESDRARLAAELPARPPSPGEDALGWLVWHGLTETSTLGPSDRSSFASLGDTLRPSPNVELLELAAEVAERAGWRPERRFMEALAVKARGAAARRLYEKGKRAGAAGDFREAARHLREALVLDGSARSIYELLLVSLVELEAEAEIARLTNAMRFAGFEPRLVAYLVERARSGKLAAEALEREAPEGSEASEPEIAPGTAGTPVAPPPAAGGSEP